MQESAAARVRQEQRAFFEHLAASGDPAPGPDEHLAPAYAQLLRLACLRRGQRIVNLACGAGRPTFAIAARVGPPGSVLGLDLTPACIAAARARARELGLHTVTFWLISSEAALPLPPASVDGATCAFGLMYMSAPVRALLALHRALRPGGRVAVSTLASPPPGSCSAVLSALLARYTGRPLVDPAAPGPFALGTEEALDQLIAAAGFAKVRTLAVAEEPEVVEDAASYWQRVCAHGTSALALASLPAEVVGEVCRELLTALGPLFRRGAVDLTGQALLAVGTKVR